MWKGKKLNMTKLKNSKYEEEKKKKKIWRRKKILTKLKKPKCDHPQKLKFWNSSKTQNFSKLKNSKCDYSKTQNVTKLKISKWDTTKKLKLWQN